MGPKPLTEVPKEMNVPAAKVGDRQTRESSSASFAAAIANCEKRAMCLARVGRTKSASLKSETSPPILQGNSVVSKDVIEPIADSPRTRFRQKASAPMALGATTPRPVMTTRRCLSAMTAWATPDRPAPALSDWFGAEETWLTEGLVESSDRDSSAATGNQVGKPLFAQ